MPLHLMIFLIGLAPVSLVWAQDYEFSGRFDLDHFESTNSKNGSISSLNDLQLMGQYSWDTSNKLSGNLNFKHAFRDLGDENNFSESSIKELFWRNQSDSWTIKAGKFLQRWGKTDIFSPVDVLVGRDQRFLFAEEDRQYFAPEWALLISKNIQNEKRYCARYRKVRRKFKSTSASGKVKTHYKIVKKCTSIRYRPIISPYSFQFGLQHTPAFNKIQLVGVPSSFTLSSEPKDEQAKAIEVAVKLAYSGSDHEWATYLFSGRQHKPFLTIPNLTHPSQLGLDFPKMNLIGFEYEKPFASWVFRADSAYIQGEAEGFMVNSLNAYWETSLALEKRLNENFRVSFYPTYRHIFKFTPPEEIEGSATINPVTQSLYTINSAINGYRHQSTTTLGFRLAFESNSLFHQSAILLIYGIEATESLFQWDYKYNLRDDLSFGTGVLIYAGPNDSQFGLLKDKSSLFGKLTTWF